MHFCGFYCLKMPFHHNLRIYFTLFIYIIRVTTAVKIQSLSQMSCNLSVPYYNTVLSLIRGHSFQQFGSLFVLQLFDVSRSLFQLSTDKTVKVLNILEKNIQDGSKLSTLLNHVSFKSCSFTTLWGIFFFT